VNHVTEARGRGLQAAGFVVLVAGTLVYSRGDQHEEEEEAKSRQALKVPRRAKAAFRPSMTIQAMPLHTVARNRWRRVGALALAAARLEHAAHAARASREHAEA
jgi:ABC-type protease/lipase transport system fused ATPase/permease subunit